MDNQDALRHTIEEVSKTLQLNNIGAFDETIVPPDRLISYTAPEIIVAELPEFNLDPRDNQPADLLITRTIGEGGMGLVQLAKQVPLAREVAVKSLKQTAADSGKLRAILQEAWITGWLEHPNIIPIYTLGRDTNGTPLIVMKRIEGNVWSDYIHQPNNITHTNKLYDLSWHIDILLHVCNAMEYAHNRGILHRDLKPENIMIGRFGEVYVLDWGIAVSTKEDLDGRLPLAKDAKAPAGTPLYMSPESVMMEDILDERSDVYLLGAILHEILTLSPPHTGNNLNAVLLHAAMSKPKTFDHTIPDELGQICNTAMHRDKTKRYQSVKAFRAALEFYQEHKNSIDLSTQAQQSLNDLQRSIDTKSSAATIAAHYGECLFGFRQALRIWANNEDAQTGLVQCLLSKLQHDLDTDNLSSAQAILEHLAQLDHHNKDLTPFHQSLAQKTQQQEKLQTIAREFDFSLGHRGQLGALIVLAVVWSALPVVTGYIEDSGTQALTYDSYIIGAVRVLIVAAIVSFMFRRTLTINEANRRLTIGLIALPLCMIAMRAVIALNHIKLQGMLAVEVILYALFIVHLALTTNIRLLFGAAGFIIGAVLMSIFPAYDDYILGGTNLCVILFILYIWHTKNRKKQQATPTT